MIGTASFRRVGAAVALVFAFAWLAAPAAVAQSREQKKAQAHEQFLKAEKMRTALEGKPSDQRSTAEYRELAAAYRKVYLITPHAMESPTALLAVAETFQQMGRLFNPEYHQQAIDAYLYLNKHYPTNRYRDDALFTIARIQQEDLSELDSAEATYQEFLSRFPRSPKAAEAKDALAKIARDREAAKSEATRAEMAAMRSAENKLPQVTRVNHWNNQNYTRVVINVEGAVKYQSARISDPDRIYFDLYTAKLSSTLAGKTLDVGGGFLKAIRVAQNQAGVVRVVLDVEKVKDYSAFLLPNPYRLVVDVYGEALPAQTLAKADEKAAESAKADESRAPEIRAPAGRTEKDRPAASDRTEVASSTKPAVKTDKPAEKAPAKSEARPKETEETKIAAAAPEIPKPTRNGGLSLSRAMGLKIGRIVIDAGHGGHDTGTVGPTGAMEKDVCLDVAKRLGRMIEEKIGAEVIYTRTDDTFVPLESRTALANQVKADMFVSIHANSSRDRSARGIETYYLNFAASDEALEVAARENALSQGSLHELQDIIKKIANNEKIEESRELAAEVQESLSGRLRKVSRAMKNRGVKKAPFVVLVGANMPSVLSEVSFLSNPNDEAMLKKPEHRERVAEGLYQGLEKYLKNLQGTLTYNRPTVAGPVAQ